MTIVDRCVCRRVTLAMGRAAAADLLRRDPEARANPGALYDALRATTGCGTGCGRCEPYFRAMLRTGRTVFDHREPMFLESSVFLDSRAAGSPAAAGDAHAAR